jgi:hypothetical protein
LALLRAVGPVAQNLVSAEEQLLDVAEDVEPLGLHLPLEDLDDVAGEPKAGPELNQDTRTASAL